MRFKQFYLNEAIQGLQQYLKNPYPHQVIDLGKVGWFRIYTVQRLDEKDLKFMMSKNGKSINEMKKFHSKIHTLKDYKTIPGWMFVSDPIIAQEDKILPQFKKSVQLMTKIGLPKQNRIVIFEDLSGDINPLTGGGVGGYAKKKKHYISISKTWSINTLPEVIIHEYAHFVHFGFDKKTKQYMTNWFRLNIAEDLKSEKILTYSMINKIEDVINKRFFSRYGYFLYAIFDILNGVQDEGGLSVYEIMSYKEDESRDVIVKKGFSFKHKGSEKTIRVPKGTKLEYEYNSRTGDVTLIKRVKGFIKFIYVVEDPSKIFDNLEFTDIHEDLNKKEILELGFDGIFRGRLNVLRTNGLYLKLEDLFRKDAEFKNLNMNFEVILKKLEPIYGSVKKGTEYIDLSDKVQKALENITTEEFYKNDSFSISNKLGRADGNLLKNIAFKKGIVPSSYSASNDRELWAELIMYLVLNPSKLSKDLKTFFKNVVMGKTQ